MAREIMEFLHAIGILVLEGYGLTETTPILTCNRPDRFKFGTVGPAIPNVSLRIAADGEILAKGPNVARGYYERPDATAESWDREGWFHTGDMARQDEEGYFYIAGRFKDMIISGGENVYAAEVEAVFREHAAVADAALIGQPDEKWGEVGLMIVACKPNQTVNADELLKFCSGRLAKYKIPKRVEFVDALPYSPYGKVIKAELKKQWIVSGG